MKKLVRAVEMSGSVKNLCKYFDRHKSFEPFEIVEIAEEVGFKKADFKEEIAGKQADVDSQPKCKNYTMVLFSHLDIGTSYLAEIDDRIIVSPGWAFYVEVDLEAKTPKELNFGLDNPRILQKIKDAGDFSGMMADIQGEYRRLVDKYFDDTDASLDTIEIKLLKFIERQKDGAIERATACASTEFGKKAQISAEARSRALNCTLKAVTLGFGIMATAAGFATTLAAGLVGLHGTLKALDSTIRAFTSSYQGFERNMCSAEESYKSAGAVVNTIRADAGQIGARILETAFGDISNSFKKGDQYLDMAEGDLTKLDDKANDIVSGLTKFILQSTKISENMKGLEDELNVLRNDPNVEAAKISKLEQHLATVKSTVAGVESEIDTIIQHCEHQSIFVTGCANRIVKVKEIQALCKPSTGAVVFIKAWDVLDLTAGILGGGFAAGDGFTGAKLVGGLNPINKEAWVTVGNFMGHTKTMIDAVVLGKDIYDTCTD